MDDNDEVGRWGKERASAEKVIRNYRPRHVWQSRQVPGTPVTAETLFVLIRDGKTDTPRFRLARAWYAGLSDEDVWAAYEMWSSREGIHQALFTKHSAVVPAKASSPVPVKGDSLFGD